VKIRKTVADGTVASSDIILCLKDGLPAEFDGKELGSEALWYSDDPDQNNWDKDFASATVTLPGGKEITTTDELRTEMLQRTINFVGADGSPDPRPINYLSHDDFFYFIRVENLSDQPQSVTARNSWIEMDRFLYQLDGSERAVIFRPADLSSVIRKPALKPEILTSGEPWPTNGKQNWCNCGWPYTLLLPRGTREGMEFRLFMMFSPGDDLESLVEHAEHEEHADERCTSISYCGLQDWVYPDKQEMGYPFNRPFPDGIPSTVANHDNLAWRTIKIRCRNL
jgi:tyrosinase